MSPVLRQKKAPDAGSRFLYYDGRKVLVRKGIGGNESQIAYPTYEELKKCMPKDVAEDTEYTYLFAVDDKSYYLGKKENVGILSEQMGYEWIDHQEFKLIGGVFIEQTQNHRVYSDAFSASRRPGD